MTLKYLIGVDKTNWWSVADRPMTSHKGVINGNVIISKATLYPHTGMSCDELLHDIKWQAGAVQFLASLLQTETDPTKIVALLKDLNDHLDTLTDAINTACDKDCPGIDCGTAPNV